MNTSASVARNGSVCVFLDRERSNSQTLATTSSGTGDSQRRFGQLNQRAAIVASASGVHTLMTTITANNFQVSQRASKYARDCRAPLVLMISHVLPSRA